MSDLLKQYGLEPEAQAQPDAASAAPSASADTVPADAPDLNAAVAQNQQILGKVGKVAKDIGVGLTEVPTALAHGALNAVNEVSNTAFEVAQVADRYMPLGQVEIGLDGVRWKPGMPAQNNVQVPNIAPEPTTVTGGMVEGLGQFLTGYIMGGRYLKAVRGGVAVSTTGKLAESAVKTAFSGAAAFDPSERRLSNLVNEDTPFGNLVTEYLAASPDDSRAEGRFKNSLEQVALNVPFEAIFYVVKGMKAKRAGDLKLAEENADAAEMALNRYRDAQAKAQGEVLDTGGSGREPKKLDTDALETSQQTGMHGAPGVVEAGDQKLVAAKVNEPKSDYVPAPDYVPPQFDQQNLLDTFALASGNGSNLDTFAGSIVGKNMARVNNENDAKAFFNVLGTTEAAAFEKAKGRPRTVAEIEAVAEENFNKLADYTGTDVRELQVKMAADLDNLSGLADRVAGYRMGVEVYSKRSAELGRAIIRGDAAEFGGDIKALHAEFLKSAQTLLAIAPLTEGVKSGLGRNLSLLSAKIGPGTRAPGKLAGIGDNVAQEMAQSAMQGDLAKALQGSDAFVQRLAQKLSLADNPKVAKKIVDDAFGPGLFDVHNEYWINALLSGPKTHIVNMSTSLVKSLLVMPTEQVLAGALSADTNMMLMAADQYAGMAMGLRDAMRLAGRAMKAGDAILDPTHMGLSNGQHAIVPSTFGLTTDTPLGLFVEGFGNLVRLSGRLLTTEDELLKQLNYRGRLYAQAWSEARVMRKQHGATDQEIAEFVSEYMERGFDANGRAVDEGALAYARDATFTNDLDVATNSGGKSIGESVNEMANNHPGLRVALPFTRVPTNIMRDAWDHTPGLNLLRKQFREELNAGGERRAIASAKMATGGAMWVTALTLAFNGDITGPLSSDPTTRKLEQDAGKQPNSFRFYDEDGKPYYIGFDRFDPYATFFSIAATMAETAGHANNWELEDLAGSFVVGLAKNLESKTYLQGLANVMAALSDPDRRGPDFVRRQMASYVPSITNTFRGADYLKDAHSITQAMLARTPGHSGVDSRYNVLGEKVKVPMGFGPDSLSPIALSPSDRQDDVLAEIARLSQTHKGGIAYPSKKRGSDIDLTDIQLGDKSAYARFQELTGEVRISGQTLRERLTGLFGSEKYKAQLKDGEPGFEGSRLELVTSILQAYREGAAVALTKESPQFRERWIADQQKTLNTLRFGSQQ